MRYGWIPPGKQRSITELEYRKAREQSPRTRCLMFLLRDEAPWPQKWIDALHDPDAAARMREFRGELNGIASGLFSSAPELVQEVMAAIHMEDSKTWKIALQGEFESGLQHSRVEPLGAPESLSNTDYKQFLSSSSADDIVHTLQTAIRSAGVARLVRVDLSTSGGWWSTRLLLLAALLQDYTQVAKLVFASNGEFIGTCGLSETRRAVGHAFPLIARAMGECLPDRPGFDPTADIPDIVKKFSARLDQIRGEHSLALPVAQHVVSGFRGFNGEKLRFDPNQDSIGRQRELLRKPYQFVAIGEPTSAVTIVDRLMFASRVAALALDRV